MSESTEKTPTWFKVVAIILLLWNLMGMTSFYMHVFITEEALALLPENQAALYDQYPFWTHIVFAIATCGGLLGSIGLLMRKKWAKPIFIVSLIAIIIQMSHSLFLTDSMEVYGLAQSLTMPILVVLVAIYEVMLTNRSIAKGWIS